MKTIKVLSRVALAVVAVMVMSRAVKAQDIISCTDGTVVIHIRTPGMCPPGYWQI